MLLEDPDHVTWGIYDFRLAKAIQIHDDLTSNGFPINWDRSERVTFDVKSVVSKSQAALDRKQEQVQRPSAPKPAPGVRYYAVPRTIDGGPFPTMEEWLEEQRDKEGKKRPERRPPGR